MVRQRSGQIITSYQPIKYYNYGLINCYTNPCILGNVPCAFPHHQHYAKGKGAQETQSNQASTRIRNEIIKEFIKTNTSFPLPNEQTQVLQYKRRPPPRSLFLYNTLIDYFLPNFLLFHITSCIIQKKDVPLRAK